MRLICLCELVKALNTEDKLIATEVIFPKGDSIVIIVVLPLMQTPFEEGQYLCVFEVSQALSHFIRGPLSEYY